MTFSRRYASLLYVNLKTNCQWISQFFHLHTLLLYGINLFSVDNGYSSFILENRVDLPPLIMPLVKLEPMKW